MDGDSEYIKSLKIVGPINGKDVCFLRYNMLGLINCINHAHDIFSKIESRGKLSTLDLSEASIEGGESYNYYCGSDINAENNIIGEYMFSDCSNLKNIILPKDIISIKNYAFSGCDSLSSITIPDCVTELGVEMFKGCTKLSSVSIGNGVTSIPYGAFYECKSLTSVTIGSSVTSIGVYAFWLIPAKTEFYF